jgi:hypothetical protein
MLGAPPNAETLLGFQATKVLGDLNKETANPRLVVTFASQCRMEGAHAC